MVIHVENLLYKYSCWKLCQNTEGCIWFSYDYKDWDCFLLESCLEVEENPYFVSSDVACQYSISHSNYLLSDINLLFCFEGNSYFIVYHFSDVVSIAQYQTSTLLIKEISS